MTLYGISATGNLLTSIVKVRSYGLQDFSDHEKFDQKFSGLCGELLKILMFMEITAKRLSMLLHNFAARPTFLCFMAAVAILISPVNAAVTSWACCLNPSLADFARVITDIGSNPVAWQSVCAGEVHQIIWNHDENYQRLYLVRGSICPHFFGMNHG